MTLWKKIAIAAALVLVPATAYTAYQASNDCGCTKTPCPCGAKCNCKH